MGPRYNARRSKTSSGKWWTLAEDRIILKNKESSEELSYREIQKLLPGRSMTAISQRYATLRHRRAFSEEDDSSDWSPYTNTRSPYMNTRYRRQKWKLERRRSSSSAEQCTIRVSQLPEEVVSQPGQATASPTPSSPSTQMSDIGPQARNSLIVRFPLKSLKPAVAKMVADRQPSQTLAPFDSGISDSLNHPKGQENGIGLSNKVPKTPGLHQFRQRAYSVETIAESELGQQNTTPELLTISQFRNVKAEHITESSPLPAEAKAFLDTTRVFLEKNEDTTRELRESMSFFQGENVRLDEESQNKQRRIKRLKKSLGDSRRSEAALKVILSERDKSITAKDAALQVKSAQIKSLTSELAKLQSITSKIFQEDFISKLGEELVV